MRSCTPTPRSARRLARRAGVVIATSFLLTIAATGCDKSGGGEASLEQMFCENMVKLRAESAKKRGEESKTTMEVCKAEIIPAFEKKCGAKLDAYMQCAKDAKDSDALILCQDPCLTGTK